MGGGTRTGGNQYATMALEQPWGDSEEKVRIFPPCQIKDDLNYDDAAMIFTKAGKIWKRKRIGYACRFPISGFVAWDDKNNEYAWHEVGTIDVPRAKDPDLQDLPQPGEPSMDLLDSSSYGDSLAAALRRRATERKPRRKRRTFTEWFLGKSSVNDVPDFLRKDTGK